MADGTVVLSNGKEIKEYTVRELLPAGFSAEDMKGSMTMGRKSKNSFVIQGSILAFAGILVRIIGLIYRIPLTRILGDEGNGYYCYSI